MTFEDPVAFREAVRQLAAKKLMPTELTSSELAQLNREVMRTSLTSAQTTIDGLLDRYKDGVLSIVNPDQATRLPTDAADREAALRGVPGLTREATVGYNPATLRTFIGEYLDSISYKPAQGEEGTIKDLSSDKRINLVVKTNVQLAHGAGRFIQENADPDVVDLWPALEFVRFEDRKEPRDWEHRWRIAARTVGDVDAARCLELQGRMCALKSSGIWQALGDGAGGYTDTLGNPYPPFAFSSGMWTQEVSRDEAEELGLLDKGEKAEPAEFDLSGLFAG